MLALNSAQKTYRYRGWQYQQQARGKWLLRRDADGFITDHHTKGGCEAFIRLHGEAANPVTHYHAAV